MIRMKALEVFTQVIRGQQYHGDPNHPNKESGQYFLARNEEDAQDLVDLGVAKKVKTVDVDDEEAQVKPSLPGNSQPQTGTSPPPPPPPPPPATSPRRRGRPAAKANTGAAGKAASPPPPPTAEGAGVVADDNAPSS